MISLPVVEKQFRDTFSKKTQTKPSTNLIARLKRWWKTINTPTSRRWFSFAHNEKLSLDSASTKLLALFPGYEVFLGCKHSPELYQETLMRACTAGNKIFWFTISNEFVELEIIFLLTPERNVEVTISQCELLKISYSHQSLSAS